MHLSAASQLEVGGGRERGLKRSSEPSLEQKRLTRGGRLEVALGTLQAALSEGTSLQKLQLSEKGLSNWVFNHALSAGQPRPGHRGLVRTLRGKYDSGSCPSEYRRMQ